MMRSRSGIVALFALGALGMGCSAAALAQNARIPGTTATISPPPGFSISRSFPGLEHETNGSRVEVQELPPAAYPELAELFTSPKNASSRYEAEGTRITRIESIDVNGKRAPLAVGDQRAGRSTVTKYITVLGGPENNSNTLLVTFSVTDPSALSRRDVESAIRSITLGPLATVADMLARLPFTFDEVAPFRVADVLPNGSVVLRIPDGASPTGDVAADARPTILIQRANTSATPAETAQFAETLLRSAVRAVNFEVTERQTVPFAGGDGSYLAATADESGLLQFVRVLSAGRYVVLAAIGEKDAVLAVRSAIEEIARSLEVE